MFRIYSKTSLLVVLILSLLLSACDGGSSTDNTVSSQTLKPPEDFEKQPSYSGALHQYLQDSDNDSIPDIEDPAPSDPAIDVSSVTYEQEFNNNIGLANDVSNNGYPFLIAGALTKGNDYYLDGDYYSFNASEGDRISILILDATVNADGNDFNFTTQSFSPSATLANSNGSVITTTQLGNTQYGISGIAGEIPADGIYYIEISDASVTAADYNYPYVIKVQQDSDLDGVSDQLETALNSNINSADSDSDGLSDFHEIFPLTVYREVQNDDGTNWWDIDNDSIVNWHDVDSDGDGPPDRLEGSDDLDSDNIPNFLDIDSNNNGKTDDLEVGESFQYPVDTDNDGLDDYKDFDADNDGIPSNLDDNDLEPRAADYMFDSGSLTILGVRGEVSDEITVSDSVIRGQNIFVDGTNLSVDTQILFPVPGGTKAITAITVDAEGTSLKVTVPNETINGDISAFDGTSLSNRYGISVGNAESTPIIYPLEERTSPGNSITISGANLSNAQVSVIFASNVGTTIASGTATGDSVIVTVPSNAASGFVSVEAAGKTSNAIPIGVIDTLDASISLPSGSQMNCEDVSLTQFGVEKSANSNCSISSIDVDNYGISSISTFYNDANDETHLLYESIILPGQSTITFNGLNTAANLVFFSLGYHMSQTRDNWSSILGQIEGNSDVQVLADRIDTLLIENPSAYSSFTDSTLVSNFQAALISSSSDIVDLLGISSTVSKTMSTKLRKNGDPDVKITPAAAQNNVLLSVLSPADINVENETRVFLSVEVTDSSGKVVGEFDNKGIFKPYQHIKHPWDKRIIAPQGWGLFLVSSDTAFKVTGRDTHFDIATGGVASPTNLSSSAYKYALGRTLFDGVAAPVLNKILEKIIGQKLNSEDAAKVIVEIAGPSAWNAFLSDAINGPDKFFSAFNLYIATPFNAAVASCLQLPVGDTCKLLTKALAKHFGWTERRVLKLMIKTLGKEVAAYIVPGVNVVKATYEVLDKINFGGSLLITGYDIGATPGNLKFDVDFPLEINEVKPECLIRDKNEKLLVKGKGFLPYTDGSLWWKKEVYPQAKLGSQTSEVKTVNADGTSMLADFSSVMAFLSDGNHELSVIHKGQTATHTQEIMVAADSILLSSISPSSGGPGTIVTLSGCGFSDIYSENKVWFTAKSDGGNNIERVKATVVSASADSLTVVVPDTAATGDVFVEANDLVSNRVNFTVESTGVVITYGDNGSLNDDTFSLYVDNSLASTMASPARPFPVDVVLTSGVHTVKLVGIAAPDSVGTYSISFSSNVTVLSGPSQSGADLTAGVVKSWQIEVAAVSGGARKLSKEATAPLVLQPE